MKILLHLPHTSLKVPKYFYKGLKMSKEEFNRYNLFMTDYGIDELFKEIKGTRIIAKYSRLFCDIEKFKDNSKEFMYQYGQGYIYTNTYDGRVLHEHDEKYIKKITKYYDHYHKKLDRISSKLLKKDNELLILDCHSYSDSMASKHHKGPFKDVCIGIEEGYYNQKILDSIISKLNELGLSYEINYPYKGSIIPNKFFNNHNEKICSIMLEINKRIYLA